MRQARIFRWQFEAGGKGVGKDMPVGVDILK